MEPLSGQLSLSGVDPLQGREFTVRKRDGRSESFNEERIRLAVESAFKADRDIPSDYPLSPEDQTASVSVTAAVVPAARTGQLQAMPPAWEAQDPPLLAVPSMTDRPFGSANVT